MFIPLTGEILRFVVFLLGGESSKMEAVVVR